MIKFHIINLLLTLTSAVHKNCMYIDYGGRNTSKDGHNCKHNSICKRNFKISYIDTPPYSTARLFESIVRKCCGRCAKITYVNYFKNITEISSSAMNSSDFITPFLGSSSAIDLYGYHFIPVVDVPSAFYISEKHGSQIGYFVLECLKVYPLVIICLLMAVISGFITWILETWCNDEDFPRPFLSGLFEGFWWSFVSMTTVGYGDRIVKSIPARIYSVVWILIGMITFSLVTALLTSGIMKANEYDRHYMNGNHVGALKFRNYEAALIVKQGGILKESSEGNFYSQLFTLIQMLRHEEIHGFVLDKYTLAHAIEYFEWKNGNIDPLLKSKEDPLGEAYQTKKDDIDFFNNRTFRTPKTYVGEKLSYGVLVKDADIYSYFRDAVRDNRLFLETSIGSEMNKLFPTNNKPEIFSAHGEHFRNTMLVISVIFCMIFLFGIMYEFYQRRNVFFQKTNKWTNNVSHGIRRTRDKPLLQGTFRKKANRRDKH